VCVLEFNMCACWLWRTRPPAARGTSLLAIHIRTSRSHDDIEPNDETCDILVPNELKNAEHLGLTVWLPVSRPTVKSSYRLGPTAVHSGRTMYNFSILNGRCCLERRLCESGNEVKSNKCNTVILPWFMLLFNSKALLPRMLRRAQLWDCMSSVRPTRLGIMIT